MQQDKKYVVLILELTHWLGPAQTESLLQTQELSLGSVPGLCSSHKAFFLQTVKKIREEAGGLTILK